MHRRHCIKASIDLMLPSLHGAMRLSGRRGRDFVQQPYRFLNSAAHAPKILEDEYCSGLVSRVWPVSDTSVHEILERNQWAHLPRATMQAAEPHLPKSRTPDEAQPA